MDTSRATLQPLLPPDGFPYLVTRIVPALYHVSLLPAQRSDAELVEMARAQVLANQLQICLVLGNHRAFYFKPDGEPSAVAQPPLGGHLIMGNLALGVECDDASEEFRARQARLTGVIELARGRGGFLPGDLSKGSHAASRQERQRLKGFLADGTPRGLTPCAVCGEWKGVCLDPSPQFAGRVMTVHCACDNHNRCARCHAPLFERRLNANYYDARRRTIFHVPGFCGLNHRCAAPGSAVIH